MKANGFLDDLRRKPEVLGDLAAHLRDGNPWQAVGKPPRQIVLLGMGSSYYAAAVAAARMRARGVVAVAELASSDLLPAWGPETLVVAISASGESAETLDALDRLGPLPTVIALTNTVSSSLASRCSSVIDLRAEREVGGVACRSFQHTLALLMALELFVTESSTGGLADVVKQSADASQHLLATEDNWLAGVADLLAGPDGTHIAAPARRLSSAQQSALMLREGPRRAAVACEAGDWAHVDVYLTKNTDYRLLVFAGSSWDASMLEWTLPRETSVVSVGGSFEGARATVRYPHDAVDDVRLLTEVLVSERVAAYLWNSTLGEEPR